MPVRRGVVQPRRRFFTKKLARVLQRCFISAFGPRVNHVVERVLEPRLLSRSEIVLRLHHLREERLLDVEEAQQEPRGRELFRQERNLREVFVYDDSSNIVSPGVGLFERGARAPKRLLPLVLNWRVLFMARIIVKYT